MGPMSMIERLADPTADPGSPTGSIPPSPPGSPGASPTAPPRPRTQGWPLIAAGTDTLIAAPTGSGKTLAGFLVAIDAAVPRARRGEDIGGDVRVVYVSPLKALAVDIHQNLERPLAEIAEVAPRARPGRPAHHRGGANRRHHRRGPDRHGEDAAHVPGDDAREPLPPGHRQRSRAVLGDVDTVIVDEIHALARDKRGSHLALTLERLEHLQLGRRPQRIGLSATQRPIEQTARLLTGAGDPRPTAIVDCGHARRLSVRIELPETELAAVSSTEQFGEVIDRIADHVARAPHHAGLRQHAAACQSASPTCWASGSGPNRSPRTTGACPRTAACGSRTASGPATCGPWWPPRRSSSASTSGRWSSCARWGHRVPSPRSSSAWDAPTTREAARPRGSSTR